MQNPSSDIREKARKLFPDLVFSQNVPMDVFLRRFTEEATKKRKPEDPCDIMKDCTSWFECTKETTPRKHHQTKEMF